MQAQLFDPSKIGSADNIKEVTLGPDAIKLEEFVAVARYGARVTFSRAYVERVTCSRKLVDKFFEENRIIYGITTGFGDNVRTIIPQSEGVQLQVNILRSHAVSVGEPLSSEAVRAVWLMQLLSLGRGYSGIRIETLSLIAECLNRGVTPYAPQEGSVQYLAIEAQINLVLMGEGRAWYAGKLMSGAEALAASGLKPWVPACKEGLSLTNGANSATGVAALALYDCLVAVQTADIAGAMAYEALRGTILGCDERLHSVKCHQEQAGCASNIRRILGDSGIMKKYRDTHVQDPYILRCMPQMHGAAKFFIKNCALAILNEMASCSDNPILWPEGDDGLALMGGNFDGTFVGGSSDTLCMVAGIIGKLSERITDKLNNRYLCDYPAFLTDKPGLNDGYMVLQYTAAGLLNEIRGLCIPSSADSIPTCANWEDPVSMGWWASIKAREVVEKLHNMIAIELMSLCRAYDFSDTMEESSFATSTKNVRNCIRNLVPAGTEDRYFGEEIERIFQLVQRGTILTIVEKEIGDLDF